MFKNPTSFQPIRRQKKPFLILTTLSDFDRHDLPFMNRRLLTRNKFLTFDSVYEHFNNGLKVLDSSMQYRDVPFHFFVERVRDEVPITKGAPLQNKSVFLKDLVQHKIIDIKYQESIVIVLADEFSAYPPVKGFLDTLNYRLLTELTALYDIAKENIVVLNDIVNWDVYEADQKKEVIADRLQWRLSDMSTLFLNYTDVMQSYNLYNNKK